MLVREYVNAGIFSSLSSVFQVLSDAFWSQRVVGVWVDSSRMRAGGVGLGPAKEAESVEWEVDPQG